MDGPDLSHLLEDANSEAPSRDVLDGIVRRHHRLQVRRARVAATLGLVLALAGTGVGIGLSRQGGTVAALSPRAGQNHVPGMTASLPARNGSESSPSIAPAGLAWVSTGSGEGAITPAAVPSRSAGEGYFAAGHLAATGAVAVGSPICSVSGCTSFGPNALFDGAVITHLFTRTSDGVTVRAFSAHWTQAPLELVPVSAGTARGGSASGAATSSPPEAGTQGASPGAKTGPVSTLEPDDTVTTGTSARSPVPATSLSRSCTIAQALVVEVSDAGAVGVITVPFGPLVSRPINVLADQIVGAAERSPMVVVVVAHTAGRAQAVRAEFAGGAQDQMNVVDEWAVLVHKLGSAKTGRSGIQYGSSSAGRAKVSVLTSNGTVIERAYLPGSGMLAMAVRACFSPGGMARVPTPGSSVFPGAKVSGSTSSTGKGRAVSSSKSDDG